MHYYKKNIGDYAKKAGRLSMLQHGAYTLLIDACYDRERFPTADEAIDWSWASSTEEIEAVKFVLTKFFTFKDGAYVQDRIREELANYHKTAVTNKRIAIERETKRKEKSTKRVQDVNEPSPNHKPLTNNHKPIKNKDKSKPLAKANPDNVTLIFNYWLNVMSKPSALTKLTPKRAKAIENRLKDGYTPEQIKSAINGCSKDAFSMGQNDRNKAFNDIELICRTGEKLEGFIETETGLETDLSFMDGSILDIKQGKLNG